jgi:hypothetical protein
VGIGYVDAHPTDMRSHLMPKAFFLARAVVAEPLRGKFDH